MSNWKVALVAGVIAGAVLASSIGYIRQQPHSAELQTLRVQNAEQVEQIQSLSERLETLESFQTDKALEVKTLQEALEEKQLALDTLQKEHAKELASLKQQKQQLAVSKKKLDTKVETLTQATKIQQNVLSNSKALYQQQLELQKQLNQAEANLKQARRVADEFKKPCDEFKSGKSWNWVSQADCDRYEQKLSKVAEAEVEKSALQQELEVLNQKIEVALPENQSE
ncbi:chromosome segregation ATPase (plasmid) [Photobacterium sp. GJ3]|uniref:chromosome segregation ATPase n=1 Tax=Photobacterium sp. GJ3 TaxID=2829502 RepID=UPI001B8B2157|nr:chromosome segregation ATPase [Photobacterium sp. GJ3]QUJ70285.1 chromosome segregation ATPase [Photobacterium sp. GJ3]